MAFGALTVGAACVVVFGIPRLAALTDSPTLSWGDAAHTAQALQAIATAREGTTAAFKPLDPAITTPAGRKLFDATRRAPCRATSCARRSSPT